MGIVRKLGSLKRGRQLASASSSQSSNPDSPSALFSRSSTKIAGAFLFIGALAVIGINVRASAADNSGNNGEAQQHNAALHVQVNQSGGSQSTGSNTSARTSQSSSSDGSGTNSTSSATNVTSTSTSGTGSGTTTHVTVNGQAVQVPANGTTTVSTPGGQTTVSGTTDNNSTTQTIVSTTDNSSDEGDAMN
jgi:cytoskeletal protein RodZ